MDAGQWHTLSFFELELTGIFSGLVKLERYQTSPSDILARGPKAHPVSTQIKCGEEKPKCTNCERQGETCDYSIRLNWEGRTKKGDGGSSSFSTFSVSQGAFQLPKAQSVGSPEKSKPFQDTGRQSPPMPNGFQQSFASQSPSGMIPLSNSFDRSSQPEKALHSPSISSYPASGRLTMTSYPYGSQSHETAISGSTHTSPSLESPATESSLAYSSGQHDASGRSCEVSGKMPNTNDIRTPALRKVRSSNPTSGYLSPLDSTASQSPGVGSSDYLRAQHHYEHSPPPTSTGFNPSSHMSVNQPREFPPTLAHQPTVAEHRAKRLRLSHEQPAASPLEGQRMLPPNTFATNNVTPDGNASVPVHQHPGPYPGADSNGYRLGPMNSPLTPAASSTASEEAPYQTPPGRGSISSQVSPDLRRLSVNSLLSAPPGDAYTMQMAERLDSEASISPTLRNRIALKNADGTTTYGLDRGFPDLDLGLNEDQNAISAITPAVLDDAAQKQLGSEDYVPNEFGFGIQAKNIAFEKGDYYANPVPVKIPRSFQHLPPILENPMNLLYFHHFLNHTARILVPHDCSENPFRIILPRMALANDNLMNLLLAYSASHRARLLGTREPHNRIAVWTKEVFPNLSKALSEAFSDSEARFDNANLATAIMLASLNIISPNTFETDVSWRVHLNFAREMIVARGGAHEMRRNDAVSYFLIRWFAYLDVLGSLSGPKNELPLSSGSFTGYWSNSDGTSSDSNDSDYEIDCLLGFTSRCVCILAKIAELSRQCDLERIRSKGIIDLDWKPSDSMIFAASQLHEDLEEARTHEYKGCTHRGTDRDPHEAETEHGWDSREMIATNQAFHWAGFIHLQRRVLGKPPSANEVQHAIREIVKELSKIRKSGAAEACLLFPMFTAGCDAQEPEQREKIMERVRSVETFGMTQVHSARTLMQKSWDTGKPWETIADGQFFG
ncbi:MAG: hypothetical protein M4579_003834 [Chaenotheca gracillima]|nr:MAG: hypothetical protein M4579_003834 [Chaenotheca gracillima]